MDVSMSDHNQFKSLFNLLRPYNKNSQHYATQSSDDVFDFLSLIKQWPEIIGDRLSQHTTPLKLQYNGLTVITTHSAFSLQLGLMERQIIQKIENHFPNLKSKIKKIIFQTNSVHFDKIRANQKIQTKERTKTKNPKLHRYSPEYQQLEARAKELFDDIHDDSLREKMISIYIQGHLNHL